MNTPPHDLTRLYHMVVTTQPTNPLDATTMSYSNITLDQCEEILGGMWWNGSYEARSHTETYDFMGEQLPKIKRINPACYTVIK